MKYYDVHVKFPRGGYSICVCTQEDLTEEEIIDLIPQSKFEEMQDRELIDSVEDIDEEEAFEWFGKDRIIKLN